MILHGKLKIKYKKRKTMKALTIKYSVMIMAILALLPFAMTSCSESDSDGGGQPVITEVRLCDPEKADSTFQVSPQGQTIAIIGENLQNTLYVYINDQKVGFNPTMNTDHSIIVVVPTEQKGFKLTAFNSDLKDEIRVETTHGTATYGFKICGGYPTISRIQGDYPRKAGDKLNIFGKNLFDIDKMYFTDVTPDSISAVVKNPDWDKVVPGTHVDVSNFENVKQNKETDNAGNIFVDSEISIVTPSISYDTGTLVIETAAGRSYIAYTKTPGQPVITAINTDMPIVGTDLVIEGREFVQISSIQYGDVTLDASEFIVAETEDRITIPFKRKPTRGSSTDLVVTTPGGQAKVSGFYDYSSILLDFEEGTATDNGWGPNGILRTPAVSTELPYISDGNFWQIAVSDPGNNWWGMMCYFRKDWNGNSFALPGFDKIPADTPAENVYLAMEVFNNNTDFTKGEFLHYQIQTIGDAKTLAAGYRNVGSDGSVNTGMWINDTQEYYETPLRAYDDTQKSGCWYRHVLPLSYFSTADGDTWAGKTYGDIVSDGINQIRLMDMNWTSNACDVDVMFDNVRIICIK